MKKKIEIPRALIYCKFAVLWITFFEELGAEAIIVARLMKRVVILLSNLLLQRFLIEVTKVSLLPLNITQIINCTSVTINHIDVVGRTSAQNHIHQSITLNTEKTITKIPATENIKMSANFTTFSLRSN